jgi:hypothetical protein
MLRSRIESLLSLILLVGWESGGAAAHASSEVEVMPLAVEAVDVRAAVSEVTKMLKLMAKTGVKLSATVAGAVSLLHRVLIVRMYTLPRRRRRLLHPGLSRLTIRSRTVRA